MKKILTLCAFISLTIHLYGQALSFDQLGSDQAYCRLFGYQSGNGVVYAAATGGTPSYTYQWTNLSNGQTTSNSVWGGLNPGDYEIKVWDNAGDSIVQIVTLDSLNPIAGFDLVSAPAAGSYPLWIGSTGWYEFSNSSQYFANPNNPTADTTFFWNFSTFSNPWVYTDTYANQTHVYGLLGYHEVCLFVQNKNGCADTLCGQVYIETVSIDEENSQSITLITKPDHSLISIGLPDKTQDFQLNLYNLSGKLIQQENLIDPTTNISFYQKGIFVYEIIDPKNQSVIYSGKFNF